MKKLGLVLGLSLMLTGTAVQAENAGPSIYKDCGIGAMIFSGNTHMDRSWASLVNLTWDAGTTASSSKSSGTCTRNGDEVLAAVFLYETYDVVLEDTAKGNGENLTALLDLMNVESSQRADVVKSLQAGLSDVLASADYASMSRVEKAEAYFGMLDSAI